MWKLRSERQFGVGEIGLNYQGHMASQYQIELGDLIGNGDLVQGWPALLTRMKGVKKNEGGKCE